MNQVVLTGRLAELQALRYTPAGIPAIGFTIEHHSQQTQASQVSEVKTTIKAKAFGALAEQIGQYALGSQWRFTGFLSSSRNSKSIVLHIQDLSQE